MPFSTPDSSNTRHIRSLSVGAEGGGNPERGMAPAVGTRVGHHGKSRRGRRLVTLLAAASALSLVLAGCGASRPTAVPRSMAAVAVPPERSQTSARVAPSRATSLAPVASERASTTPTLAPDFHPTVPQSPPLARSAKAPTASPHDPGRAAAPSPAVAIPPAAVATRAATAIPAALDFTGTTLSGGSLSGESLYGKAAVLWFWAPWCAACRYEAPTVVAAARRFAGTVEFVGVGGFAPVADMRRFAADAGLDPMPQLVDVNGDMWPRFGVVAQPALAFIRPDGSMDVVSKVLSADELAARVAGLTR
jgi:thiol-disulfide isomerase/thioredoxin